MKRVLDDYSNGEEIVMEAEKRAEKLINKKLREVKEHEEKRINDLIEKRVKLSREKEKIKALESLEKKIDEITKEKKN